MNLRISGWAAACAVILTIAACQINSVECDQECVNFWLDGSTRNDTCGLPDNKTCLVSRRFTTPNSATLAKPVFIAVHGYTASTFEWEEFREYAEDSMKSVHVSRVLLGAHGRDIDAFQSSSWEEWGRPILEEYDSLRSKGFENINFACVSTGCALLMAYINGGSFRETAPKWIYMIDPIVVPSAKLLSLANIVGPILGNSPNPGSDSENVHWYVNRPQETLRELYSLINRVKNELESGFTLPKGTRALVYKSKKDGQADPVGLLLLYKGMRRADGSHIEVKMEDSRLHVMTRLRYRDPPASHADTIRQGEIFNEMRVRALAAQAPLNR